MKYHCTKQFFDVIMTGDDPPVTFQPYDAATGSRKSARVRPRGDAKPTARRREADCEVASATLERKLRFSFYFLAIGELRVVLPGATGPFITTTSCNERQG